MFTLDGVVPWGRSFEEYCRMFVLGDAELKGRIVGVADGPASFNSEAARRRIRVTSADPLYRYSAGQIRARIEATYDRVLAEARRNRDDFVWNTIRSVEELGSLRRSAMERFLEDFGLGTARGRYLAAELPRLPFSNASFDLALCSHFLFLHGEKLTAEFHLAAAAELSRVAREVRIFPLLALDGRPSPHVAPVSASLRRMGAKVTIVEV